MTKQQLSVRVHPELLGAIERAAKAEDAEAAAQRLGGERLAMSSGR